MEKPIARGYYDRIEVGLKCEDESLAVQASKDECDINYIVKKYLRTGEMPAQKQALYADISQLTGLQDALHMVDAAEAAFMELPAEVRRHFDNDPVKLVEFAHDDRNYDKAVELGLVLPKPPSQPGAGGAPVPGGVKPPVPGAGSAPSQPASSGPNTHTT